jgi:selT/selW/selH-like putative selenoprotein
LAEEIVESLKVPVGNPHPVTRIELTPGVGGVFDVFVDGVLVFSKHRSGRHAEPGEVMREIRKAIG